MLFLLENLPFASVLQSLIEVLKLFIKGHIIQEHVPDFQPTMPNACQYSSYNYPVQTTLLLTFEHDITYLSVFFFFLQKRKCKLINFIHTIREKQLHFYLKSLKHIRTKIIKLIHLIGNTIIGNRF